jgi:hypothetical protein
MIARHAHPIFGPGAGNSNCYAYARYAQATYDQRHSPKANRRNFHEMSLRYAVFAIVAVVES